VHTRRFLPTLYLLAVAGIMAVSWASFSLAEAGLFGAPMAILVGAAAAGAVLILLRRRRISFPGAPAAAALLIAFASLWGSLPPGEFILGGWDPGVYIHTAASISRTGALRAPVPDLAALSPDERRIFDKSPEDISQPFRGIWVPPDGRMSPQFFHLYPSLMAVGFSLAGLRGALCVNPLLNIGCILGFFLLASRFFDRRWALAATLLFAANPGQVWQSRFPTAEMLTQFLLLAGFVLLGETESGRPRPLEGLLAGLAFGLAMLCRYDTVMILAGVAAVLALSAPGHRRRANLLWVATGAALPIVHAAVHSRLVNPWYLPMGSATGAAAAVVAGAIVAWLVAARFLPTATRRVEGLVPAAAALGLAAWSLFAWFVRPRLAASPDLAGRIAGRLARLGLARLEPLVRGPESSNFLFLVSLLGVVGTTLAILGAATLIARGGSAWRRAWLYGSLGVTLLLTVNVFHDHFMMWVSRRFVPVALPFLCLAAAAGAREVARWTERAFPRAGRAAGPLLVAAVLAGTLPASLFLGSTPEWPGLAAWFEDVDRRLPAGALVITDQPGFAAPLRFVWGRPALELRRREAPFYDMVAEHLARPARRGEPVYLLSQARLPEALERLVGMPGTPVPLKSSMVANAPWRIPTGTIFRGGDFVLYRVREPG
jgi:4-amino-4-deoxy-L-arabinose transferase-like glycosyltransferase